MQVKSSSFHVTLHLTRALILAFCCVMQWANANDSADVSDKVVDVAEVSRLLALSDDVAYGQYLAGECVICHQPDAMASSNSKPATSSATTDSASPTIPVIQGLPTEHIARVLLEYRYQIRTNETMVTIASSLSDEQIAVIAKYLSTDTP